MMNKFWVRPWCFVHVRDWICEYKSAWAPGKLPREEHCHSLTTPYAHRQSSYLCSSHQFQFCSVFLRLSWTERKLLRWSLSSDNHFSAPVTEIQWTRPVRIGCSIESQLKQVRWFWVGMTGQRYHARLALQKSVQSAQDDRALKRLKTKETIDDIANQ